MPAFLIVLMLFASAHLSGGAALARDDGRYAQSPHKPWFDSLRNKNGMGCCSDADGVRLEDPEWDCDGNNCRVRLDGTWHAVPPEALLDEDNRVGYAIVWRTIDPRGQSVIHCFLRGAQT
jgi:hypothetical protein